VNPVGIGAAQPDFNWDSSAVQTSYRNLRQTAYEIQPGEWDSGKVLWLEIFQDSLFSSRSVRIRVNPW
jgi:hypothetical protein